MHEIRSKHFKGRTIPKENQKEYDAWDTFNAYCKNVAASRGYKDFCGIGEEVTWLLHDWYCRDGEKPMPKKAILIESIMQSEESFAEFKKWFHGVYLPRQGAGGSE